MAAAGEFWWPRPGMFHGRAARCVVARQSGRDRAPVRCVALHAAAVLVVVEGANHHSGETYLRLAPDIVNFVRDCVGLPLCLPHASRPSDLRASSSST